MSSASTKIIQAAAGNAAGGAVTYVEDVFSTYLYEGNGGTQHIENGIALTDANSGGSVEFDGTDDRLRFPSSTGFQFGTGDFTVECWAQYDGTSNTGLWQTTSTGDIEGTSSSGLAIVWYQDKIYSWVNGSGTNTGSSAVSANTWYHIAMCRSSGTTKVFLNGTEIRSVADTRDYTLSQIVIGGYTSTAYLMDGYVSNFRVVKGTALYTSAFTPSTTALTAVSGTSLLTCQGDTPLVDNSSNAHTITVNGDATAKAFGPFTSDTEGKGGLVWLKNRDAAVNHQLHDTERGVGVGLNSNNTNAEYTDANSLTAFNSNGFTVGPNNYNSHNQSGVDFASWTFAKQEKFFDVVTYTGDGTLRDIPHNLGSVPGTIIVKRTDGTNNWYVQHRSTGPTKSLFLDTTSAATTRPEWGNTAPTDSVFTVDGTTVTATNYNGFEYVAYLFAHNDGDGGFGEDGDQDIIKCGSFTSSGQEIDLGFEPQWLLVKATNTTNNWAMFDTMRGFTADTGTNARLRANTSDAEGTNTSYGVTSTGFVDNLNNSNTYIYIAIRRGPMKTPESGTEVFDVQTSSGVQTTGFPVDASIGVNNRSSLASYDPFAKARLLGGAPYLTTSSTAAQANGSDVGFDSNTGLTFSWPSSSVNWYFRRAPGFFDVVNYTGDDVAGHEISHNLGVVPEMMIIKNRSGYDWIVYHQGIGNSNFLRLNAVNGSTSTTHFDSTTPTESVFTVGDNAAINSSSFDYIAYLFATLPGISKVGTYTGNGTGQTIDCGFSAGARFVLIKRTDGNSNWNLYDTERGIVAGNDPRLELDSTDAEDTGSDDVDPDSSGFAVTSDAFVNTNGASYAFLAIA